ncbi:peptidase M20 [Aquimarina aggregata]|uniref:Peptidase M20 n=1 Tax=Aquimarina aggregata TaxID=1642818 RepID=A0A163CCA1_9FLAO|nr:M20/M25/M40 family metallo-hydrolase [Aquimarina aggregata]KZS42265.1 peptidase M20 [Aquimarina aggregata]
MHTNLLRCILGVSLLLGGSTFAQDGVIATKEFTKEIKKLTTDKSVQIAINEIDMSDSETIKNMIELTEIPAPPFKETKRAKRFVELFSQTGIDSVWIDAVGNVLALRKGKKRERTVVLDAHIDTVFPEETDVTVKIEGSTYAAPGIGDNTRGMAMLIAVLKGMNKAKISTDADIVFVGTVGEEGLGDLRGVKHLFSKKSSIKIDSWISIDGGGPSRIINGGLGSKRYKAVFKGKGGHSWGAFGLANPHHALGKGITLFVEEASKYVAQKGPKTSFNIGRIGGGTSVNSIPFESWAEVDMRSLSPERLLEIDGIFKASMRKAEVTYNASGIKDKVTLELVPIGDRPSGTLSDKLPLIQRSIAVASYLGISPKLRTGSTNSNIPIAKNIPAITISRGGKGGRAHALDETWTNTPDATKNIKMALLITLAESGIVN